VSCTSHWTGGRIRTRPPVDQRRGGGLRGTPPRRAVIELRSAPRPVVEQDELLRERVGGACARPAPQPRGERAPPGAVAVAYLLDRGQRDRLGARVDERAAVVAGRGEPLGEQRENPDDAGARVLPAGREQLGDHGLPALAAPLQVGADEFLL